MVRPILDTILVPVASADDALDTSRAVRRYFDPEETAVTVVYVVEKAGGAPDKASVEQRREVAEEAFEVAREELSPFDVDEEIVYDTDVADGILNAAAEIDANAVVFVPRKSGRIARLLSGDVSLSLVTESDRPVVALPSGGGGT